MRLAQFRQKSDRVVSWPWNAAPRDIQDLAIMCERQPEFVTVVPAHMRFSHLPPNVQMLTELADGYIAFE